MALPPQSDANNNAIRYVVISSCSVTTLAGTPGATGYADGTVSTFNKPSGIAIDSTGSFALVVSVWATDALYTCLVPVLLVFIFGVE